jgi:DNA transformation protein and related proteins
VDCCFVGFVLGQLDRFDGLGCRAMFGGHGLFRGRTFFGIVSGDRLYLKTDGETVRDYVDRGMKPFHPGAAGGEALGTYYEVPADVLGDRGRLAAWARAADRAADRGCSAAPATPVERKRSALREELGQGVHVDGLREEQVGTQ